MEPTKLTDLLYPTGLKAQSGIDAATDFYINSGYVKVFPSAWRGSELTVNTDELGNLTLVASNDSMPFNPESALNTEYNTTRTAGGFKTFIDSAQKKLVNGKDVWTIKFFINGYAFELQDIELENSSSNLYANIRVGDIKVENGSQDCTKVLLPYSWTDVTTPMSLDIPIAALYLSDSNTLNTDKNISWKSLTGYFLTGGANLDLLDLDTAKNTFVFTGLMLSTQPIQANNSSDYYYSIQLLAEGEINYSAMLPLDVAAGQCETPATRIGYELIANNPHMLAVGTFNASTTDKPEKTIFAVGNGLDNATRQNAFEVLGSASSDMITNTVVIANSAVITDNAENAIDMTDRRAANIFNINTINEKIAFNEAKQLLAINKPNNIVDDNSTGITVYNKDIALAYNDSEVHGLYFNQIAEGSPINTIGGIEINPGTNKLNITGIQNINPITSNSANYAGLTFDNVGHLTAINGQITIAPETMTMSFPNSGKIIIGNQTTLESDRLTGIINLDGIAITPADGQNYAELSRIKKIVAGDIELTSDANSNGSLLASTINVGTITNGTATIKLDNANRNIISIESNKSNPVLQCNNFTIQAKELVATDTSATDLNVSNNISNGEVFATDSTTKTTTIANLRVTGTTNLDKVEATAALGDSLKQLILDTIYPVGSIYMCMDDESPVTKFKFGKWKRIAQGRTLIGANDSTFKLGNTGGTADLVVPSHSHAINKTSGTSTQSCTYTNTANKMSVWSAGSHNHTLQINSDSGAHNHNIPVSYPITTTNREYFRPKYFTHHDEIAYNLQKENRPQWWQRIYMLDSNNNIIADNNTFETPGNAQMLEDRLLHLIPTVQRGTWLEQANLVDSADFNSDGGVKTGTQQFFIKNRKASITAIQNDLDSRWKSFFTDSKVNEYSVFGYSKSNEASDIDRPVGKGAPWWLNNDYYGIGNDYINYLKTLHDNGNNGYFSVSEVENILNAIKDRISTLVQAAFNLSATEAVETNTYKLFSNQVPSKAKIVSLLAVYGLWGAYLSTILGITGVNATSRYFNSATVSQICTLDGCKQYEIKEAFIKDYLKYCIDGDRSDDGAHRHTGLAHTSGSHIHELDLVALRQYLNHTHPDSSIPSSTELNKDSSNNTISGVNANLPPYLVCNIWQRMPDDWNEEDDTPDAGGGVTPTPGTSGGSIGNNPGIQV